MLYFLSFIDPNLPVGQRSLGVAIVEAVNFTDALKATWFLGINPGGEVQGVPLAAECYSMDLFNAHKNKLMTKADAAELGLT